MAKKIVVIGNTGEGKSKFLNCASNSDLFEDQLSAFSVTKLTSKQSGKWRNTQTITDFIDTQGLHDTEGNDTSHVENLVSTIKQEGHINMVVPVINGTNPRLSTFTKETIKLFSNIFGLKLFDNLAFVFTHWNLNERGEDHENRLTNEYNQYLQGIGCPVGKRVPCFFIDSHFDKKNLRGFYTYDNEVRQMYEARFQNILGTMISFDDLSVSQIQVQLTERDQLKNEVVVLQKQLEKKTYSGFGPSNAPFGTKWALGVYSGWRDGTASECIIPEGWRLVSGTTICYAHGKCPQGNPYGKVGNMNYNFTIERVA